MVGYTQEEKDRQWKLVIDAEHAAIEARRQKLREQEPANHRRGRVARSNQRTGHHYRSGDFDTRGLALSGGGIRSAAFSLGALQALYVHGHFDKFDYLSTVSGGGYTGTAISSAMSSNGGHFPFLEKPTAVSDPPQLSHVRDFSNYLMPRGLFDVLQDIAIVLRGIAAIAVFAAPLVLLLAAMTVYLNPDEYGLSHPPLHLPPGNQDPRSWYLPLFDSTFAWTKTIALLLPAILVLWALAHSLVTAAEARSEFKHWTVKSLPWVLTLLGLVAFVELQPVIIKGMELLAPPASRSAEGNLTDASSFFGWLKILASAALPVLISFASFGQNLIGWVNKAENTTGVVAAVKRKSGKLLLWVVALVLPLSLWSAYLLLVYWGIPQVGGSFAPQWMQDLAHLLVGFFQLPVNNHLTLLSAGYFIVGFVLVLLASCLGPNANSLHRLYRDRLQTAFMSKEVTGSDETEGAMKVSHLKPQFGPYHIINAALNIQGAPDANRRERNADFFHFSRDYSGSAESGYAPTSTYEKRDKGLTLSSAMAISGAAVSSNMGSQSIRILAPTLALANARLGYWQINPLSKKWGNNLFYLYKEAFGRLRPDDRWLYLTDGGHIENLGVYALLKRRCKLILAIDGEADPNMTFGALAKLERYARIDLGCRIDLCWQGIADATQAAKAKSFVPQNGKAGPHCAVGNILYEGGGSGTLIYVKSSLTGDESNMVCDYLRRNSEFPHESTGDQFFSEEQFEAYRALGFHAVNGLFKKQGADVVALPGFKLAAFWSKGNATLKAAQDALKG